MRGTHADRGDQRVKMGPRGPRIALDEDVREYRRRTPGSARIFAKSARMHVGGVSHNIRYFEPYPFVTRSSAGRSLTDVDGNRYTDYWMGHWSLVLGHADPGVTRELASQVRSGWMYGTVNEQTIRLSTLISGAVPAAEKTRYTASGTEAVMYAARIARAHTGRRIIAKAEGGWHGYASDLLKSVNLPFDVPEGAGMGGQEEIVTIPYNDPQGAADVLRRHAGDLAGVVVEPLLGGGGCIPAEPDYLRAVQEAASKCGALFILDEIVTGFRLRYGCAYEKMGLDPDIVTLGKIIGGGMPIGAICGKEEVMRRADDGDREGRAYVGGGTFSANPASMVAGAATLGRLKSDRAVYGRINELGGRARDGLERALAGRARVTGTGSLFMAHFGADGPVDDPAKAAACDREALRRYHFGMIARDGIFILPGKMGAVSDAHSRRDIDQMVAASERSGVPPRGQGRKDVPVV